MKLFFATALTLLAIYIWYPPARLLALVVAGRSPVCPMKNALQVRSHIDDLGRAKDRFLTGSHLVKEEAGLELWDTPKGPFWIPKGNRFVLPLWIPQTDTYFPHSDPPLDPPLTRAPRFRQWIPASND